MLRRRRVCKNRERVLYLVSVSESVLKEVLRNRVVAVEGADERLDVVEHRDRSQIHCKNSTSTAIESDLQQTHQPMLDGTAELHDSTVVTRALGLRIRG